MILDVRGKNCPIPLLRTRHHIQGMNTGDIITVLSTDYGTIRDMQTFCKKHAHTLQSVTEKPCAAYDIVYQFVIQKGSI